MEDKQNALTYIFKIRKLLVVAIFLGGIIGCGITFLIPKKYLSTAIIYPYNSHTVDELSTSPQFGYEVETEQLLQLLESKSMRDRTIDEFKLYDYYKMDTTKPSWKSDLALKYIADVNFFRSKYLSVVINVTTEDPEMSAIIANFQVSEVNNFREDIFEENRTSDLNEVEKEFLVEKEIVGRLKDSIYLIKGDNGQLLYNFLENLDNENYDAKEFVNSPELEQLVQRYIFENDRLKGLNATYRTLKQNLSESLPSVYSIDKATPSYKKVSPSFVVNSLLFGFLFFGLALTIRLVFDKYEELKDSSAK